ncbi:MAG: type III-A CRISPR-associated RAMP protein Csm4 [Bacteroidales bacterium]|nr:type III-A CRISPR-associated RAMP protein Csm4 [Bacteroidales bacterium]
MKKQLKLCCLSFTAPLHIGNVRNDYDSSELMIHSDTLYAAIMQAWSTLGKNDWITPEVSFAISSLLPYTTDQLTQEKVLFFKKPYLPANQSNVNGNVLPPADRKRLKKTVYVDADIFEKLLAANYTPSATHIRGKYVTEKSIDAGFISSSIRPRIQRSLNAEEDTRIFYMEQLYFNTGSGLYFLYDGDESSWKKVEAALRFLGEAGLGTDRTVGQGRFDYASEPIIFDLPDDCNHHTNLSLYLPSDTVILEKIHADECGFELIRRGGWIGEPYNSYRKRSVYMFREGAVLSVGANRHALTVEGATVDLRPEKTPVKVQHPIYRVGRSLFFPIRLS